MLWHIDDTSLYLMGSIHALERSNHALFPEAERAYQQVDRVTFEHDMVTPPNPMFLENIPGKPLSAQVPPAVFANAAREWVNLGRDPAGLEQFQPWFVATVIGAIGAAKRGIEGDYGVDKILWGRAEQDRKTRSTLETQDDALGRFAMLPADEQSSFLDYATNPPTAVQNDIDVMLRAWHDHDVVAFSDILRHRLQMWPVGFEKLITGRNRTWMPRLLQLAADNVPTLVVVGALHCVGDEGIPSLLEKEGLQSSRIV
jgi:uncharacterized protein YbaP (TraB family)